MKSSRIFIALGLVLVLSCAGRTGAIAENGEGTMKVAKAAEGDVCFVEPTEELRKRLTPEQFAVLVNAATEPPFRNAYWDNHERGLYVDAIDGTPLFASSEKFDSGTGWPSFFAPVDDSNVTYHEDYSLGTLRIEIRARKSGGHLGHVFDDGPLPTRKRYCVNSASLRFLPLSELEAAGYGEYLPRL